MPNRGSSLESYANTSVAPGRQKEQDEELPHRVRSDRAPVERQLRGAWAPCPHRGGCTTASSEGGRGVGAGRRAVAPRASWGKMVHQHRAHLDLLPQSDCQH